MKILVLRVINSSRHRKGLVRGYIHSLFVSKAFTRLSGTGIRQISHRFMFQIGLLLLSLITDFFGCLLLLFFFPTHQNRSYYAISQSKGSMLNGDCLSLSIDNGNAFMSRYVMLCHASDTTLPLFDTSVTVANMNFPRSA